VRLLIPLSYRIAVDPVSREGERDGDTVSMLVWKNHLALGDLGPCPFPSRPVRNERHTILTAIAINPPDPAYIFSCAVSNPAVCMCARACVCVGDGG